MRRLMPTSLRGQVLAVMAAALVAAQAVSLWLFSDERDLAVRAALTREALDRAANVVALLDSEPPEARPSILAAANSPLVRFSLDGRPALDHAGHAPAGLRLAVGELFPRGREVRAELHEMRGVMPPMPGMPDEMQRMHGGMVLSAVELELSVALADGGWLNVTTRFHNPPLQWGVIEITTFAISAVFLVTAVWLLLGRIVGPLRRLSVAADRVGRGEWVEELPPSGPEELSRLTVAFNRMQARLRRFVDERTRMLAALGHDLRSPLTALKVRAEMVDDDETREALSSSIDEMHRMVEATLAYARGTATSEQAECVELGSFLGALVEEFAQTGRAVTLAPGPAGLNVPLRPIAARRALRNLVENALRYGDTARLSWEARGGEAVIHVDDDGPGIPESDIARVFEPFVRLEGSRSRETGGSGLGLAIARSILRAHGGEVTLENREGGGLRASARLPLAEGGTLSRTE